MSVRVRLPNPLTALDDRALLARFADERDQPAFEQLVKRHGGLVYGVCKRAVRDAHLAEDAFQAVFLVLARNPRRAAEAASVGGWLFGVARRVGLAARRGEVRREKRETRARRAGGVSPLFEDEPPRTSTNSRESSMKNSRRCRRNCARRSSRASCKNTRRTKPLVNSAGVSARYGVGSNAVRNCSARGCRGAG